MAIAITASEKKTARSKRSDARQSGWSAAAGVAALGTGDRGDGERRRRPGSPSPAAAVGPGSGRRGRIAHRRTLARRTRSRQCRTSRARVHGGPRPDSAASALQSGHALRHPRPHRAQPDRTPPHRHRADGAVQLPVRPPHRRHVRPPPRGHGRRPQHGGVREGHPRRAPLAGHHLGRGPGRRRLEEAGPYAPVPPDGAARRLRRGRRRTCSPRTRPTRATARPRSSTRTARPRRPRSCRPATSAAARR